MIEQIDAKITTLETALLGSAQGGYSLDTTQGRQSVTTASPSSIESLLSVYMKARAIKNGTYEGTRIVSVNYTP